MTITEQQARAIAFLASASRPYGARRWDEAGTYAAVIKLRDRRLTDVALAFIRAADDRDANTPNVLLSPASQHWKERDTGWQPTPDPYDLNLACGICDKRQDQCQAIPEHVSGHAYIPKPVALAARPTEPAAYVSDLQDRRVKAAHIDTTEQGA